MLRAICQDHAFSKTTTRGRHQTQPWLFQLWVIRGFTFLLCAWCVCFVCAIRLQVFLPLIGPCQHLRRSLVADWAGLGQSESDGPGSRYKRLEHPADAVRPHRWTVVKCSVNAVLFCEVHLCLNPDLGHRAEWQILFTHTVSFSSASFHQVLGVLISCISGFHWRSFFWGGERVDLCWPTSLEIAV